MLCVKRIKLKRRNDFKNGPIITFCGACPHFSVVVFWESVDCAVLRSCVPPAANVLVIGSDPLCQRRLVLCTSETTECLNNTVFGKNDSESAGRAVRESGPVVFSHRRVWI